MSEKLLIWASPPCQSYTTVRNTAKYATKPDKTIPQLGVREICQEYGDEYIIENVENCNDLRNPIKLNGYAFSEPINMTRKFETSFNVESNYTPAKTKSYKLDGLIKRKAHNMEKAKKADLVFIKNAPEELTVPELRSYIPPFYVHYLLDRVEYDKVIDLYCGAGGVANALEERNDEYVGIDIMDKSDKYPGEFIHGDASNREVIEKAISKL